LSEVGLLETDAAGVIEFLDDQVFSIFIPFILENFLDCDLFASVIVDGEVNHPKGAIADNLI
jgi:hypothetical protein